MSRDPSALLRIEVLDPQFQHESRHLLPHYVAIEKVLAAEHARLGLISADQERSIVGALDSVDDVNESLLHEVPRAHGHELREPQRALTAAFDIRTTSSRLVSAGPANPDAVRMVPAGQSGECERLRAKWYDRSVHSTGVQAPATAGAR
ncbi:hypothetical protein V1227_08510 [Lentzea sp. DG1S-22]|uniref:hypothetical protein n=1 Tax=Lentzea sp. DG1S-22 TaxID=3108822 RepID=UPI002E769548|nr:hypothetical protein [Lentzea sp. DG1S-22]WVH82780.1 hypothetical protein V1227_08510 [Lentzea sp. DG1S-22]